MTFGDQIKVVSGGETLDAGSPLLKPQGMLAGVSPQGSPSGRALLTPLPQHSNMTPTHSALKMVADNPLNARSRNNMVNTLNPKTGLAQKLGSLSPVIPRGSVQKSRME